MEQTGEPIGSNLTQIINNVFRTLINKEKIVKKLDSHPRPENLDSLKVKKCNTERPQDSKVARLYFKGSRSNLQS